MVDFKVAPDLEISHPTVGGGGARAAVWPRAAYDVAVAVDPQIPGVPRGRHAPPLEVRLTVQRRRLFEAAASVFARLGYADASAEAISREAGMSKATFYEHFANKEECLLALFDRANADVIREMGAVSEADDFADYEQRVRAGVRTFLGSLVRHPESAYTLIVSIQGAGPRAAARRDAMLETYTETIYRDNARYAPRYGAPTFATRDDAFAIVGAVTELVARHLRAGRGDEVLELEPVISRLVLGALDRAGTR
jgi:AcrR family transcriptional regulator